MITPPLSGTPYLASFTLQETWAWVFVLWCECLHHDATWPCKLPPWGFSRCLCREDL